MSDVAKITNAEKMPRPMDVFSEFPLFWVACCVVDEVLCGNDVGNRRRGTGEEGEDREGARQDGRRERLQRGDDGGRRRGRWGMDGMNGNVGRCAESAVGVIGCAIGVGVRDLHGAQDDDHQHTEKREEDSPRSIGACLSAGSSHTLKL